MAALGGFNYGFDDELSKYVYGGIGSQQGSQTGGASDPNGILGQSFFKQSTAQQPNQPAPSLAPPTAAVTPSASGGMPVAPTAAPATAAPTSSAPAPVTPGATTPTTYSNAAQYQDLVTAIQNATDPNQKAVAQDQLARSVFKNLTDAGHDVKWQGDQLMVDGRPYVLGSSAPSAAPAMAAPPSMMQMSFDPGTMSSLTGDPTEPPVDTPTPEDGQAPPGGMPGTPGNPNTGIHPPDGTQPTPPANTDPYGQVAGFDLTKLKTGTGSAGKYTQAVRTFSQGLGSGVNLARGNLEGMVGYAKAHGFANAHSVGDDKIDFGDGNGPIDVITSNGTIWFNNQPGAGGGTPATGGTGNGAPPNTAMLDILRKILEGSGSGTGPTGPTTQMPAEWEQLMKWLPTLGDAYTPTEIGTGDIPDPTGMFAGAQYDPSTITPEEFQNYIFNGFQNLPGMGSGAMGESTDALIQKILANPESMGQHTVDLMKGQQKDELAQMATQNQQELGFAGNQLNLGAGSPWLQSEAAKSRYASDQAMNAANRNIDITAAQTNFQDRLKAGELGASRSAAIADQKIRERSQLAQEQTAGEQLKVQSKQQELEYKKYRTETNFRNEDNIFKAKDLQTRQLTAEMDAQLKAASVRHDTQQFNETMKAKAKELNISEQKLMADTIMNKMDILTKKYGIDIGAEVDYAKIAQMRDSDKNQLAMALAELEFKYASLAQQDAQFGANLGFEYGQLGMQDKWHTMDMLPK